ncbi:uncharacterized protein LOC133829541 [Humulus lupulus]|uniref:uncharacterized protein LOC133829541 n=1 Tax=Humulus lupulus TaxID=3486 RepID=UPI002B40EBF2|nr:uncharacterized protein LOC133829541 [Humulus lupulus]
MGNAAASCAPSLLSSSSSNGVIRVLSSSDGRMEIYRRPIKAAELMLQNPGMFVCDSTSLQVGHRIHGLSADQLLDKKPQQQQQQLYLLLPMELLYSVLTLEEMASFNSLLIGTNLVISDNPTKSSLNHSINFGKIFPSLGEFCMFLPQSNSSNDHNSSEVVERNYCKQRSWRPALDTIVETTPSSKQHY